MVVFIEVANNMGERLLLNLDKITAFFENGDLQLVTGELVSTGLQYEQIKRKLRDAEWVEVL